MAAGETDQKYRVEQSAFEQPVVGFENHGGRTYIGDHTPFGKVFTAWEIQENQVMKALYIKM